MDVQRAADLSRRLHENGLRATAPRVEVLAALEDLGGHRSADEVRDLLAARGRQLPRSSVYNVLTSLAEANLALTADAGPGPRRQAAGDRQSVGADAGPLAQERPAVDGDFHLGEAISFDCSGWHPGGLTGGPVRLKCAVRS